MSKIPRLLPLVGIAIGGVIAVNALAGARDVPRLLSGMGAAAEEALAPKAGKHGKGAAPDPAAADAATPKAQSSLPPGAPGQTGPAAPAICAASATDLAKAAGMSPAELQVLQSLQTRRGQIDDREKDLDTEVQLLAAAEAKLDGKIKSMNGLKADIQALMGQADVKTQAEVDRLTVVYSKMKPQDAASVMAQLDDKVRLPIAAAMKPAVLSLILGKMGTLEAKDLTEKLAHKFAPVQALAAAANAPIPPGAPPATPPTAKTPPAKTPPKAAPDDAPQDVADAAPVDAKAKPPVKPRPRPKQIAKKAPPKPKKPAADAKAKTADPATPSKPQPYTAQKDAAPAASSPAASPSAKSS